MNTSTLIAPPAVVRRADVQDTHAIQALDSAHFIHPFTDHGDLSTRGSRVITRADGIYVWDSEGHQILDAMSGLWCVNAGYGRKELADAVPSLKWITTHYAITVKRDGSYRKSDPRGCPVENIAWFAGLTPWRPSYASRYSL